MLKTFFKQYLVSRLLAREFPPDLSANPVPCLYRAAFNLSLNTIRDRKKHVLTDNFQSFEKHAPADSTRIIDDQLHAAIAELNPAAAQIVILRYVHDYSLAEIARTMGTTRSTVAVSLFRWRSRWDYDCNSKKTFPLRFDQRYPPRSLPQPRPFIT
jgi:RNA polymerase sigma factor (sigma-70 family)